MVVLFLNSLRPSMLFSKMAAPIYIFHHCLTRVLFFSHS
jgi:hypothetical protein